MRIDETTVAYHSIIWFACDVCGRIIIANSNEGSVPTFVSENLERAQMLANRLCGLNAIDRQRNPQIDYELLAKKGFYCAVNNDPFDGNLYQICAKPQLAITLNDLEEDIRKLLSEQTIMVDLSDCDHFYI